MQKKADLEVISKSSSLSIFAIYTYDLKKLPKSKAVRFVYLLKGRNNEPGIVKGFKGRFLANGCFMIPYKKDKEMREIFDYWNISFKKMDVLTN